MAEQELIEFDVYDISSSDDIMGDTAYLADDITFVVESDRDAVYKQGIFQRRAIREATEGRDPDRTEERTVYRSWWSQAYYLTREATSVSLGRKYIYDETIIIPKKRAQNTETLDEVGEPPAPDDCDRLLLDVVGSDGRTIYSVSEDQFIDALAAGDVKTLIEIA